MGGGHLARVIRPLEASPGVHICMHCDTWPPSCVCPWHCWRPCSASRARPPRPPWPPRLRLCNCTRRPGALHATTSPSPPHPPPHWRAPRAQVDTAEIDILLVGDSSAMVVHGHDTTLPITLGEMIVHCKAVARGARRAFLVGLGPLGAGGWGVAGVRAAGVGVGGGEAA